MRRDDIVNEYFKWMCRIVRNRDYPARTYQRLLNYLFSCDFNYILEMDDNRAGDGVELRYQFGREKNYPDSMIATYLDDRECSVLEMMVALSIRLEKHITDDPEVGDRTGQWFWGMISNLGLVQMTDARFSESQVEIVIQRFLNREYERNGKGGLFTVEHCRYDLRNVEIWYQASWYLDGVIYGRQL